MFNHLFESEDFQRKYQKYMNSQKESIYSNLIESLDLITKETYATFDLLENLTKLSFKKDYLTEDKISQIQAFLDNPTAALKSYIPFEFKEISITPWYEEKSLIGKIVAFIKGIAKWLWYLVKVVFDAIRRFIVRAFGGKVDIKETKQKIMKLKDALTRIEYVNRGKVEYLPTKSNSKFAVASNIQVPDDIYHEGFIFEANETRIKTVEDAEQEENEKNAGRKDEKRDDRRDKFRKNREIEYKPKTSIITIDLKNEIHSLKVLTDHFLNIYDNSYGSNHENLFGAHDLEIIVNILYDALQDIKHGRVKAMDLKTGYAEIRPIEAGKVRASLIATNTNLEDLKKIFSQTHAGIMNIGRLINAKQMQALNVSPHIYKFLTMETYGNMLDMIEVIEPRIEEALESQKKLEQTKKQFSAIAAELEKLSPAITALGTVSYVPEQQQRIINLLQSTKYLTQIVQLRLGALTLYIRYLEEVNNLLKALSIGGKQFANEFKLKY